MDFRGPAMGGRANGMDAMGNMPPFFPIPTEETESEDHVKWQSSQTACLALNKLIKKTASDASLLDEGLGTSRGWQREPSFDQIPGFSRLSTNGASSSSLPKTPAASSGPRSVHSRPRPAAARSRSPAISPDVLNLSMPLSMPFKADPAQFLDLLKGVSARLDENVGVRSKSSLSGSLGPTRTKPAKKPRSSTSELQAGRAKKGRVNALRQAEWDGGMTTDKGKGKAKPEEQQISPRRTVADNPLLDFQEDSLMDVDRGENQCSGGSGGSSPDFRATKTLSQIQMPPPPAPRLKHSIIEKIPPDIPITSPSPEVMVPIQQQQQQQPARHYKQPDPQPQAQAPNRIPQLHPLLLSSASSAPSSASSLPPQAPQPQVWASARKGLASAKPRTPQPKEITPEVQPRYPPPKPSETLQPAMPSSTPNPPIGSQPGRPPALGMRRTHTFPSSGMATSLRTNGALPTRQKGFKPPLLSGSQPQSQRLHHEQPLSQPQQHSYDGLRKPTGSNGSTSSESPCASSSSSSSMGSASTTSSRSVRSVSSPLSSHEPTPPQNPKSRTAARSSLARAASASDVQFRAAVVASPPPAPVEIPRDPVESLPQPPDGDFDSSFGDMSFDMDADALEATMRLYD